MTSISFRRHLRLRSSLPLILVGALGLGFASRVAVADVPPAKPVSGTSDPQAIRLVHDADVALRAGHIELAILQLKNAVVLQPRNGDIRAQLGRALLAHGDLRTAESELRNGRADGGSATLIT